MRTQLPPRDQDYTGWYNTLVKLSKLAEESGTRGSMVIRPYGFAIWERIRDILDAEIRRQGCENAYFPLLIPLSYFSKEASHVSGFAKECAVVTHYRLQGQSGQVVVDPTAKLEEPLIIRPTSEVIFWQQFKRWIQSYRDLPIKLNQWGNVLRWEKRTRPFLRSSEILWQEGHTAHADKAGAIAMTMKMLQVYANFIENYLAIPSIQGIKTTHERFAGAENTYTFEALMQDGKALQLGTCHFLGQNFSKAFNVQFTDKEGNLSHVWGTSWGMTTRMIGALVMMHGDDKGLVIPPRIAPIQVVLIPIYNSECDVDKLQERLAAIASLLREAGIRTQVDDSTTHQPGWKFHEYELKGVPLQLIVGPRELAQNSCVLKQRHTNNKEICTIATLPDRITSLLESMQVELLQRAKGYQEQHTLIVDDWEVFKKVLKQKKGFLLAHWDGTTETEIAIQAATSATIRCIPLYASEEKGSCIYSGKPSSKRVVFAQAY